MRRRPLAAELRDWVEIVIEENSGDLLRYFQRRVTPPADAADLLGNVFLVLWQQGARVPATDEGARMWCFGIARNVLREHRRTTIRAVELANKLRDHVRFTAQQNNSADVAAETEMRASDVRRAMTRLNEGERELLMLIYWDGFSIANAARLLTINESTARTRHVRALRRLEATLHSEEQILTRNQGRSPTTVMDSSQ